MSKLSPDDFPWKRSRFGYAVFFLFSILVAFSVLRLALFLRFGWQGTFPVGDFLQVMLIGFHRDCAVALVANLPLLFWFCVVSDRTFSSIWHRVLLIGGSFIYWVALILLCFTEYYFFAEFKSRFNTLAVDYLPRLDEVFGHIRGSYPVAVVVVVSCVAGLAWLAGALVYFRQMWFQPTTGRSRFAHIAVSVVLAGLVLKTVSLAVTHFSSDRALNEIANNGVFSLAAAAYTRTPGYPSLYRTLPRDEAYARVRKMLKRPRAHFVSGADSIRRIVSGDANRPRLNVVILLEKSLSSEFWGCLGLAEKSLTPEMDKLALGEGILFTNIYACGNQSVRGLEGVCSSFPPLPGNSIVRRDRSENVETLARVLKRDGYNTMFLYGGSGLSDNLSSFVVSNGWDRFIGQKDFEKPAFATVGGVCDEEVFDRALKEFRALANAGKPFFGTVLPVSNQQPFTYPADRIPEDPNERKRDHAVKYSDWSLGQFFAKAKKESFWTNTVFVVVADQGAHVFGKPSIPIHSYEIPLLILGPAVVEKARQVGVLGSSLDVPTTILGLIGRPYQTVFFGRDLLSDPPATAYALLNLNHVVGMFANDRMVTLSLQKTIGFYEGNPKVVEMKPISKLTPECLELEKDTTALFQVADELYMNRRYRIDSLPATSMAINPPTPNSPAN